MRAFAVRFLVLALALGACGPTPVPCPVRAPLAAGPAYLWKVQRGDGPVVWLFGTIHDAGLELVPPVALAALDGSARFASELGDAAPDRDALDALATIAHGPGIDQQLGDDWWDLRDALRGTVKEDVLRRARPWWALILVNGQSKGPRVVAMDAQLADRAKDRHLPIDGLETAVAQVTALDAVVTLQDLRDAIHTRKALRCSLSDLAAIYATGDVAAIEPQLVVPRTAEVMLWVRNRAWRPALDAYLAGTAPTFVAVGLGHLLGGQGLPALLAASGVTVTRVDR